MSGMGKLISYESVNAKDVERDLQQKYGQRFEVIEVKRGGVRPSGRVQPDSFFVRAEDGTKFRYTWRQDEEVVEFYPNMRFGNAYLEQKLRGVLDELFGSGNYAAQAIWYKHEEMFTAENINTYDYEEDEDVTVDLFLAIQVDEMNYVEEAEKLRFVYDAMTGVKSTMMLVGYLKSLPGDMNTFMAYETTGVDNTFSAVYGELVNTGVLLSSYEPGTLEIEKIAAQLLKNSGRE